MDILDKTPVGKRMEILFIRDGMKYRTELKLVEQSVEMAVERRR